MLNKDLERVQMGLKPLKPDYVKCFSCECEWFEQVRGTRLDINEMPALGMTMRELDGFILLRCLKCGDMQEPPLTSTMMNPLRPSYDAMLDSITEKKPEEEKVDEQKS